MGQEVCAEIQAYHLVKHRVLNLKRFIGPWAICFTLLVISTSLIPYSLINFLCTTALFEFIYLNEISFFFWSFFTALHCTPYKGLKLVFSAGPTHSIARGQLFYQVRIHTIFPIRHWFHCLHVSNKTYQLAQSNTSAGNILLWLNGPVKKK